MKYYNMYILFNLLWPHSRSATYTITLPLPSPSQPFHLNLHSYLTTPNSYVTTRTFTATLLQTLISTTFTHSYLITTPPHYPPSHLFCFFPNLRCFLWVSSFGPTLGCTECQFVISLQLPLADSAINTF